MPSSRKFALVLVLVAAALTIAACGSNGYGASGSNGSSGSAAGGGKPTLTITSPANGARVSEPFMLKFTSNQPIGPTDSGKDHVHLFVDGNSNSYQVVTSSPAMVKNLPPGKHTLKLTLQHADHSPVGPSAEVAVTVTKGSGSGSGGTGSSGGGYGY